MKIRNYAKHTNRVAVPNLVDIQLRSYESFLQLDRPSIARKNQGLEAILQEIFPVISFDEKLTLEYTGHELGRPRYTPDECHKLKSTYGAPFKVRFRLVKEEPVEEEEIDESGMNWYILKVQVNREDSIRDTLDRRVKMQGLEEFVQDIVVPVEEIAEFNREGKRRIVRKKLYPGYIMVNMVINDDTWFLVRETPGIGDFTGSVGKPTPMAPHEVRRIIKTADDDGEEEAQLKTAIAFKAGDRIRVKDGYFQNFEGDVEDVDQANGRVTVLINIFNRSTPVELEHWQIENL